MKNERRKMILKLVSEQEIITQDLLVKKLIESGFDVTQATVSRDIKKLGLVKVQTDTGYSKDALPPKLLSGDKADDVSILKSGISSMETAQNLLVVQCPSGLANAVCVSLEKIQLDGLVGMLAGDDTIFIAAKSNDDAEQIRNRIVNYISQ